MTEKEFSRRRGFSTLELFVVIGVILILVGVVSLNAVNMIDQARRETALSQISAVFRAARQGARTRNEERRVVLEVTYSGNASTRQAAYDEGTVLRYWVEEKRTKTEDWSPENISPPLDGYHTLPPGIFLMDIDGRAVIPSPPSRGPQKPDGTRSFKFYVVYNSKGVITHRYREDDETPSFLRQNVALHFMYDTTEVDMSFSEPPTGSVPYDPLLLDEDYRFDTATELQNLQSVTDHRYRSRTQSQTLFLLRLSGQSKVYEYGIYPPWPRDILPESSEGPA